MLGRNYLFVFLEKKLSNTGKHVSDVRIYKRGPLSIEEELELIFCIAAVLTRNSH
jgi:hypothetical protein